MVFTAGQFRAARALLGWSQKKVAAEIGISDQTVKRMENDLYGPGKSQADTTMKAREVFESAGVVFLGGGEGYGPGVAPAAEQSGGNL